MHGWAACIIPSELHMAEADGVGVHERSRFADIVETARMEDIMQVGPPDSRLGG